MDQETYAGNKKQVRRLRKGRAALLATVVALLLAGVIYAFWGSKSQSTLASPGNGRVNILVLGVDERQDDVGRSDTCFVVTIDGRGKKVTMLSIPRDSRVKIPGHGWDKINHAFAFGGSKLSKQAVEGLLGIPIDYTVIINFDGFVHMVDALGGIKLNVEKRMVYSDPYDDGGGLHINLQPGLQTLDGKKAIEYVRYRDTEGDIGRVRRQQHFMKAVLARLTEPSSITKLPEFLKQFARAVKTDMPLGKMLSLLPSVNEASKAGLKAEMVTGSPAWIKGISYWLPDIKDLRTKVAHIQGITTNEEYWRTTEQLASEYAQSVPREIKVAAVPPAVSQTAAEPKKNAPATKPPVNQAKQEKADAKAAQPKPAITANAGKTAALPPKPGVTIKPLP